MKSLNTLAILLLFVPIVNSEVIYLEDAGQVVGEAEIFSSRSVPSPDFWAIKPTEESGESGPQGGPIIANARGGEYIQIISDDGIGGGQPTQGPSIEYKMRIETTGLYQLHVRWDGNTIGSPGNSDSFFADIIELKDGVGGDIADWYELAVGDFVSGDFNDAPWNSQGGFEANVANPPDIPLFWQIDSPGTYTLRFTEREDGVAIDAWAFQLASLGTIDGFGPTVSAIVPEPSTYLVLLIGLAFLGFATKKK